MQRSFSVFCRHRAGSYSILAGLTMSVLVGIGGLGTEAGLWYYKQQSMQAAADSGALSAATANSGNIAALETQANSVAASYGYVDGADGSHRHRQSASRDGRLYGHGQCGRSHRGSSRRRGSFPSSTGLTKCR